MAAKQLEKVWWGFSVMWPLENYLDFTGLGLVANSRGTAGVTLLLCQVLGFASLRNTLVLSSSHGSFL